MPKRDPKTGRFRKSADTGKSADPGSRPAEDPGADSATGKDGVRIHTVRRRIGNRVVTRPAPTGT